MRRQIKRSRLYHLINIISPINHLSNAKVDAWGGAIIIGISISGVFLMRTLLAAAQ
ncbi:MAG TPA: hypothetical protein VE344_08530 [Methylomirabilota bacterium]|nr:hypothetical protein [Methylomirabilota bacterium]